MFELLLSDRRSVAIIQSEGEPMQHTTLLYQYIPFRTKRLARVMTTRPSDDNKVAGITLQ
jgi:hypothetical protein|eukprot:scaffold4705_cov193-Alexandrium_tamarense.AAC.11